MTKLIAEKKRNTYYFRGTKIDVQPIFLKKIAVHVFCPAGTQEKFRTFCRKNCMQNIIAICHPSTAVYVPGAQGGCRNSNQKFPKSEKHYWRRITYGTYIPTTVTNKTHGQNIQI
jgi:hypothetical protein